MFFESRNFAYFFVVFDTVHLFLHVLKVEIFTDSFVVFDTVHLLFHVLKLEIFADFSDVIIAEVYSHHLPRVCVTVYLPRATIKDY
jgi:hypothetical protein